METLKIADDYPTRALRIWQFVCITLCLFNRFQQRAVRLLDGLFQVFAYALLFNQDMGFRDISVNETGMVKMDLVFK